MECCRCEERYDAEIRRPKILPCGHTFCLPCLSGSKMCFADNKAFPIDAATLPDDMYLLGLLKKSAGCADHGGLCLWCEGCGAEASELCVDDGHKITTLRRHRHQQVLQALEQVAALLEDDEQDDGPIEALLAGGPGVELTYTDGKQSWTSKVQLGGSMAEPPSEAWTLALSFLLQRCAHKLETPGTLALSDDANEDMGYFGLGLFGDEEEYEEEYEEVSTALATEPPTELPTPARTLEEDDAIKEMREKVQRETQASRAALIEDGILNFKLTTTNFRKLTLLQLSKVRKVIGLRCNEDPVLALKILEKLSPQLVELQLRGASPQHLLAAHKMPGLRRLVVSGKSMWDDPIVVPPLEHEGGLEHLKVCLHESTASSLIRAHNKTLKVVKLKRAPFSVRRPAGYPTAKFTTLAYFGRGQVGNPVTGHIHRSPYFTPRREGEFPVLERIEYHEDKKFLGCYNTIRQTLDDIEVVEKMFPGVFVGLADGLETWEH